jgi:LysM repeat protein
MTYPFALSPKHTLFILTGTPKPQIQTQALSADALKLVLLLLLLFAHLPLFGTMGTGSSSNSATVAYSVKQGDTLYGLSRQFGVSVQAIQQANSLASSQIQLGQTLYIPRQVTAQYVPVQPAANPVAEQVKAATVLQTPVAATSTNTLTHVRQSSYTVKSGDSLYKIASLFKTNVKALQQANRMSTTTIHPGQVLSLPAEAVVNVQALPATDLPPTPSVNQETATSLWKIQQARNEFSVVKDAAPHTFYVYQHRKWQATLRDNVPSQYAVRKDGVQYNSRRPLAEADIRALGFEPEVAAAFSFVSSNEGGISDLNFYDGAGSFGFIQFTIKYKAFDKFIEHLRALSPEKYEQYAARYGIQLEKVGPYASHEELVVYAPEKYRGKTRLTGTEIIDYIITEKRMYGVLIQLGKETAYEQVWSAHQQYYLPAMELRVTLPNGKELKASEVFTSSYGKAALVDLCVKLGQTGARLELQRSVTYLGDAFGVDFYTNSYAELWLIENMAHYAGHQLVRKRMQKLIGSLYA